MLLPRLLAFAVALIALDAADSGRAPLGDWWPPLQDLTAE
jgi:hypothetical protein